MMKAKQGGRGLVLHASDCAGQEHPLVPRLVEAACAGLGRCHEAVEAVDLSHFRPWMSEDERRAYFGPEPLVSNETRVEADRLRGCTSLVFVYVSKHGALAPTIKAWIERVLVPGVGFAMENGGVSAERPLDIRHVAGVVIHRERASITRRLGDTGKRVLMRTLRPTLGLSTLGSWLALNDDGALDARSAEAFVNRVRKRLA
jgi:putative NADPH-quinone reductase